MTRLPVVSGAHVIKAMERAGFDHIRTRLTADIDAGDETAMFLAGRAGWSRRSRHDPPTERSRFWQAVRDGLVDLHRDALQAWSRQTQWVLAAPDDFRSPIALERLFDGFAPKGPRRI